MKPFRKDVALTKVEETASGLARAYFLSTSEDIDSDNERCVYADTKPEYQAWSEDVFKATTAAGQEPSLGNIRLMHTAEVAGKATRIDFDDAGKRIFLGVDAVDKRISDMLRGGYLTGGSQGGQYLWRRGSSLSGAGSGCQHPIPGNGNWCVECEKDCPVVDYAAKIAEVSLVDRPANPKATFLYVKSDGSKELRKFSAPDAVDNSFLVKVIRALPAITEEQCRLAAAGEDPKLTAEQALALGTMKSAFSKKKTKRVAGEDLPASAFAFVGDPEDTSTWKLPIHFSTEEKSARHVRNALARFSQTQGIPESEKSSVLARIKAAAHRYGIDVEGESKAFFADLHKAVVAKAKDRVTLSKGLYEVGRFAELLQGLAFIWESSIWEADYEEDNSKVPGMLQERIEGLAECLVAMCEEEARELTAAHKTELAAAVAKISTAALSAASGEIRKGAIMNEETIKALFKGGKEGMHKLAGHFKKMAEDAKDAGQIHESIAADNKAMAEAHDTAADLHGEARKSTETGSMAETSAEFHKKGAEHHKKIAEHHAELADKCMKMHKAHMAACKTCKAMGDGMEDDEAGKAARAELAKSEDGPVTIGSIDVDAIVQKAVAAATTAAAASSATQIEALTKSISELKTEVEKKTDPAQPAKLFMLPRGGASVTPVGQTQIEEGAVGF